MTWGLTYFDEFSSNVLNNISVVTYILRIEKYKDLLPPYL